MKFLIFFLFLVSKLPISKATKETNLLEDILLTVYFHYLSIIKAIQRVLCILVQNYYIIKKNMTYVKKQEATAKQQVAFHIKAANLFIFLFPPPKGKICIYMLILKITHIKKKKFKCITKEFYSWFCKINISVRNIWIAV